MSGLLRDVTLYQMFIQPSDTPTTFAGYFPTKLTHSVGYSTRPGRCIKGPPLKLTSLIKEGHH